MSSQEAAAVARADELVFEEKPGGMIWIVFVVGVLLFVGLFAIAMPPNSGQKVGLALMSVLFGALCGWIALHSYQTRNDAKRFYGDRAEVLRNGELMQTVPYAQVETVAYGFRGDNDQFLAFTGPGKQPFIRVTLTGAVNQADETELNNEKLIALRDLLYEVVAGRMVRDASRPEGAPWFGTLRIAAGGIHDGAAVVPWSAVTIDANESNGRVAVRSGGRAIGQTSMIEDNVTAGLIAIERLRAGT